MVASVQAQGLQSAVPLPHEVNIGQVIVIVVQADLTLAEAVDTPSVTNAAGEVRAPQAPPAAKLGSDSAPPVDVVHFAQGDLVAAAAAQGPVVADRCAHPAADGARPSASDRGHLAGRVSARASDNAARKRTGRSGQVDGQIVDHPPHRAGAVEHGPGAHEDLDGLQGHGVEQRGVLIGPRA